MMIPPMIDSMTECKCLRKIERLGKAKEHVDFRKVQVKNKCSYKRLIKSKRADK